MTSPAVDTVAPAVAPPVIPATPPALAPAPPLPAAPAGAPVPPAPAVEPVKPTVGLSRDEILANRLQAIKDSVLKPRAEPAAPAEPPAGTTPPPAGTEPAPVVAAPAGPAAAVVPDYLKVPIPEGHPLREGGATEFLARNEQEARALRGVLNDYTRRTRVQVLEAKIDEYEREKAASDARSAAQDEWRASPDYAARMARVQEVRDSFGDEVADLLAKGIDAGYGELEAEKVDAALAEITERRVAEAGHQWISEARTRVTALPAAIRSLAKFNGWFDSAVQSFNAELGLGHFPQLQVGDSEAMHREFLVFFDARLRAQPEITALVNDLNARAETQRTEAAARAAAAEQDRERIKQEGIQEFLRKEADKRAQVPPHALGTLSAAARDRMPAGSEAAAPVAAAPTSPGEARQQALDSARRRGAAMLPQGRTP